MIACFVLTFLFRVSVRWFIFPRTHSEVVSCGWRHLSRYGNDENGFDYLMRHVILCHCMMSCDDVMWWCHVVMSCMIWCGNIFIWWWCCYNMTMLIIMIMRELFFIYLFLFLTRYFRVADCIDCHRIAGSGGGVCGDNFTFERQTNVRWNIKKEKYGCVLRVTSVTAIWMNG